MLILDARHRVQTIPGSLRCHTLGSETVDPEGTGDIDGPACLAAINNHPADCYLLSPERGTWRTLRLRPVGEKHQDDWLNRSRVRLRAKASDAMAQLQDMTGNASPLGFYMPFRSEWHPPYRNRAWTDTIGYVTGDFIAPSLYVWSDEWCVESYVERIVGQCWSDSAAPCYPVVSHRYGGQNDPLPISTWRNLLTRCKSIDVEGIIWWMAGHQKEDVTLYEDELRRIAG